MVFFSLSVLPIGFVFMKAVADIGRKRIARDIICRGIPP